MPADWVVRSFLTSYDTEVHNLHLNMVDANIDVDVIVGVMFVVVVAAASAVAVVAFFTH